MKKTVKTVSLLLAAVLFAAVGTSCKDAKYSAYDSSEERYDYYLPDYVKAGKYEGIELPDLTYTPTDEEVSDFIMSLESQYAPRTLADDRPCKKGDIISIACDAAFKDTGDTYSLYQFRENGKGQGYFFTVGVGDLLFPALDEAIIGMKKGETKEVTLTLPDPFYKDYINSGRELDLKIKLLTVENIDYSAADEEFYAEHFQYSKDAYIEVARNKLAADRNKMTEGYQTEMAWKYFLENSELIKVPEDEYNEIYNGFVDSARSSAQSKDISLLEYVQSEKGFDTLDEYYADLKESTENICFEEMLLYYVIRCEDLEYDDSYYEDKLLELCEEYQITEVSDAEDFLAYYYGGIKKVREDIRFEYAKKWISDRARINEDLHTVNK